MLLVCLCPAFTELDPKQMKYPRRFLDFKTSTGFRTRIYSWEGMLVGSDNGLSSQRIFPSHAQYFLVFWKSPADLAMIPQDNLYKIVLDTHFNKWSPSCSRGLLRWLCWELGSYKGDNLGKEKESSKTAKEQNRISVIHIQTYYVSYRTVLQSPSFATR